MNESKVLPTFPATHTVLNWNVVEVMISLGQGKVRIDVIDESRIKNEGMLEFVSAITLAPSAAANLCRQLNEFVADYERRFGKIPYDPTMQPAKVDGNVQEGPWRKPEPSSAQQFVEQGLLVERLYPGLFHPQPANPIQDRPEPVVARGPQETVPDPGGSGQD